MPESTHTNSIGMEFVHIEPGDFLMGNDLPLPDDLVCLSHRRYGDFDERPVRRVAITRPFELGTYQVTNAQYELFDPSHRALRGKLGFSHDDDEAVVFVSWGEAAAFCAWLAGMEGLPYSLPTEAQWGYACRAGTNTPYHTGDGLPKSFHKNARVTWYPDARSEQDPDEDFRLTVGRTPPNPWGLYDMHGNVEEWCSDWYGPYDERRRVGFADPIGRADGYFRVTRGGSHSTELYYLRSANRSGTVPEERSWLIGFRVAIGEVTPQFPPIGQPLRLHERNVQPEIPEDISAGPDASAPYFNGPRVYVNIPPDSYGPAFSLHNHVPAVVSCPNGDVLAIWYTCDEEPGRELGILASRLRWGADEWEPASPFWDAPDRNDHASALLSDGATLYHLNGLSAAATYGSLATIMRTSSNSGATWSKASLILPDHGPRHMPIASAFQLRNGTLVLPCDAVSGGHGGTALWMSEDAGRTWRDPGGTIAGIHASVVELDDGRLMALGRGDNVDGMMPMSLSDDRGATWAYSASPFPPIGTGQRLVLRRLREGPILAVSFATAPMTITDESGAERDVEGMFCALSLDEGRTWTNRRLVSDDGLERPVETLDGWACPMGASLSERLGYLTAWQAPNGLIHLLSSRNHYAFNHKWLVTPPPAP